MPKTVVGILLFDSYETLDVHGPIEFLGVPPTQDYFKLVTVAETAGPIKSKQGVTVIADFSFNTCPPLDILLVPGGVGTRMESMNWTLLIWLSKTYNNPEKPLKYLLSVCTGAGLLAKAGLLDGKNATSNKLSWDWVVVQSSKTNWIKHARWVADGNIITSAGVSAGMDMILFMISRMLGEGTARQAAKFAEYNGQWKDPKNDPWGDPNTKRRVSPPIRPQSSLEASEPSSS